jgi:hypothetical protein
MLQPVITGCMRLQGMCVSACVGYCSRSSSWLSSMRMRQHSQWSVNESSISSR